MADIAPIQNNNRVSSDIYNDVQKKLTELSGGDSTKTKEILSKAIEVLSGENVKVSRGGGTGVDGNIDTTKTSGATGVPVLDNPDDIKAKEADLAKLIAFIQLDNEQHQTEMAKERIELSKSKLDTEHSDRMKKIDESIQKMKDAENASLLNRIFGYIGAVFAIAAAVVLSVVSFGVAAGFAIAGAVLAVTSLVMNETGLTEKLIDALAEHFRENGDSVNDARMKAALIVNLTMMAAMLACSIGSMVGGIMSAASTATKAGEVAGKAAEVANKTATVSMTMKNIQTGVLIGSTTVGAGSLLTGGLGTFYQKRADDVKADVTELEKIMTALRQRLDENDEELRLLLEQIEGALSGISELITSATDTSDEIAKQIGEMA